MHILICGDSLLLRGIARTLHATPGLNVVDAGSRRPDAASLAAFQPDVLIVDQAEALAHGLPQLIYLRPNLPVIGLDTDGGQLVLFSDGQRRAIEPDELPGVIEELSRRAFNLPTPTA